MRRSCACMRVTATTRLFLAIVLAVLAIPAPGEAGPSSRSVSGLSAALRAGQVFVTWDDIPVPGWRYRVYRHFRPIADAAALAAAEPLGSVRDSSAVDRARTRVMGALQTFRVDSAAAPLAPATGLFVHTPDAPALAFFAVLAESAGAIRDSSLMPGVNTLAVPVPEWPEAPLPVWQRRTQLPPDGDDYVLWVRESDTPVFPAMSSRPNTPTHLTLRRGAPGRPLTLFGHARGGNSYNGLLGSGYPGESILCVEDALPTGDYCGFTFGYGQDYDLETYWNPVRPPGGIVIDYVQRRMRYALEWAHRVLLPDSQRVYVWGGSMGGSLAFFMSYHEQGRIAAALGVIPKLCTGYTPDSYLELRDSFDRIWGRLSDAPMSTDGIPVFDWLDGRWLAANRRIAGASPHSLFFGRADTVVGWPEKVAYASAMQTHRIGGALFWDTRRHFDDPNTVPWKPTQTARRMHAFRLDRSFPALSRCSADDDMGDGSPASGDSMGTINGRLDWDTSFVDLPDRWECTLRCVALPHRSGTFPAPESAFVDVTPRRLQRFLVATGIPYSWSVVDVASGLEVQSGEQYADSDALLTIPQVHVTPFGARLTITHATTSAESTPRRSWRAPAIRRLANPVRARAAWSVGWFGGGGARVRLLDAAGRQVSVLFEGAAAAETHHVLDAAAFAPGLYWIEARQGEARTTQRIVVLR